MKVGYTASEIIELDASSDVFGYVITNWVTGDVIEERDDCNGVLDAARAATQAARRIIERWPNWYSQSDGIEMEG